MSSSPASASARSPSPLQQGVAAGDENDPSASNPGGSPATAAPGTSVSTDGDDADHPPVKRSRNSLDSDGGDSCGISPDDDVGPPGQAGEVGRRSGGGVRVGGDGEDVSGGDGTADDTDATSSAVGGAARVSWATGRNPTVEGVENGQGGDAVVNEPASVMEDGESQSMDEELKDEELPTWAGLAGSRRYLAEGVWRVAGNPVSGYARGAVEVNARTVSRGWKVMELNSGVLGRLERRVSIALFTVAVPGGDDVR